MDRSPEPHHVWLIHGSCTMNLLSLCALFTHVESWLTPSEEKTNAIIRLFLVPQGKLITLKCKISSQQICSIKPQAC